MRAILLGSCALSLVLVGCNKPADTQQASVAPASAPAVIPVGGAGPAEAYVRGLYADVGGADFGSQNDESGPRIYSASTWGKIQAANAKVEEGDMGPIEAEPLCQCQDNGGLTLVGVATTATGTTTADAVVDLKASDGSTVGLTLKLVQEAGGWKVDDVQPHEGASLLAILADA